MTWQPGCGKIADLISDGELEQVEPSDDTTKRAAAGRCPAPGHRRGRSAFTLAAEGTRENPSWTQPPAALLHSGWVGKVPPPMAAFWRLIHARLSPVSEPVSFATASLIWLVASTRTWGHELSTRLTTSATASDSSVVSR